MTKAKEEMAMLRAREVKQEDAVEKQTAQLKMERDKARGALEAASEEVARLKVGLGYRIEPDRDTSPNNDNPKCLSPNHTGERLSTPSSCFLLTLTLTLKAQLAVERASGKLRQGIKGTVARGGEEKERRRPQGEEGRRLELKLMEVQAQRDEARALLVSERKEAAVRIQMCEDEVTTHPLGKP